MAQGEWDERQLLGEEIRRLSQRLAEEQKRIAQIASKLKKAKDEQVKLIEFYEETLKAVKHYKEAPVVKLEAFKDTANGLEKMEQLSRQIDTTIEALERNLDDAKIFATVLEDEIDRLEKERAVECKVVQFRRDDKR